MGVLQSIPLCARGKNDNIDIDNNNNNTLPEPPVQTSQPIPLQPPPEATSTPRPLSPTGLANDQYSDSHASSSDEAAPHHVHGRPPALSSGGDSGLEDSATDFEFSRPTLDFNVTRGVDEGVHEEDTYDDTLPVVLDVIDDEDDDDDASADGHEEIDLNDDAGGVTGDDDPVERPPEPTVPDERIGSSSDEEAEEVFEAAEEKVKIFTKDETTRKISNLLSELAGDHPSGFPNTNVVPLR
jgi:hypothetical protein